MKYNRNTLLTLVLVLAAVFLLAACRPAEPTISDKFTTAFRLAYNDASRVYEAHVVLDAKKSVLAGKLVNLIQNLKDQVHDDIVIADMCYQNTEEFFTAALTGAFGQEGIGGQDTQPLLSLLMLKETYPEGSVEQCQRAANSIIVFSRSNREEAYNIKGEILRVDEEIAKLEYGDLKVAAVTEFYNKYGGDLQDLVNNGDAAFADFVGSKSENQRLPMRYIGFPTGALQVTTRNTVICDGYSKIYSGEISPPLDKYAYQYPVSYDPVAGLCVLKQAAAEGYIRSLITPQLSVAENLESGCTSVLPGGCDQDVP
jgi:hypothetical protein